MKPMREPGGWRVAITKFAQCMKSHAAIFSERKYMHCNMGKMAFFNIIVKNMVAGK